MPQWRTLAFNLRPHGKSNDCGRHIKDNSSRWLHSRLCSNNSWWMLDAAKYPMASNSVEDPWHFSTDPDTRIRTTTYGSGSVPKCHRFAFLVSGWQDANKTFYCFLHFLRYIYIGHQVIKDKKSKTSQKIVEIKGFLLVDGMIRIRINNDGSGSSKNNSIPPACRYSFTVCYCIGILRFLFLYSFTKPSQISIFSENYQ
jgi:hypothetical protein